jgi:hypothetical protein
VVFLAKENPMSDRQFDVEELNPRVGAELASPTAKLVKTYNKLGKICKNKRSKASPI